MTPYESFVINAYFWLLILLIVGVSLIALKFLGQLFLGIPLQSKTDHTIRESRRQISYESSKSIFSEKVGEKVVRYMIDISRSTDPKLLRARVEAIRKECVHLNKEPLPPENKKIISSVLYWSRRFDVDRHIYEMKAYQTSSQIQYDVHRRDFQLKVITS